ncbi:hypothetical protein [Vannielia litorea]|uniref:Type II toxin-antitoxin system RelE/ParE family toxin n=1 Tax=Vannielia litorea TaxID=1217970 RepID=A0A1N6FP25_9RHOB|nr:hypothetical protein [Vannielia litorea]SIN97016.1 hypothetical protein SAMN05444002_1833 [Vannielia litorea]
MASGENVSEFTRRGVKVVAETTEKAEFDIRCYHITDAAMDRIAARLKEALFSPDDRVVGDLRIRELEGYDVVHFVGRDGDRIVVTIAQLRVPDPDNPTERILEKLGRAAIFRGATGL